MANCNSCGAVIPAGKKFCTSCGTPVGAAADVPAPPSKASAAAAPVAAPAPAAYVQTNPEIISTGAYVGLALLALIPVVGLVIYIVMACGVFKRINVRNYARAAIILWVVGLVLGIIFAIVFSAAISSLLNF